MSSLEVTPITVNKARVLACAQITTGLRAETEEGGPLFELVDSEGRVEMAFAKPPLIEAVPIVIHNAVKAKHSLPEVPFENGVVYQFTSPEGGETTYHHDFRSVLNAISKCFDVPFKRPSDEDKRFHFASLDAKKHNLDTIRKAVIKYTKVDDDEETASATTPKTKKKRPASTTQGHTTPDSQFVFGLVDNHAKGSAWTVSPLKVDKGITDLVTSKDEDEDEDMDDANQEEEEREEKEDKTRPTKGGAGSKRSASDDGSAASPPKKVRRKPATITVENEQGSPDVAFVELQEMDTEEDATIMEEVLDLGGLEHVVGETADPRVEEGVTVFTENAETSVVFTALEKRPDLTLSAPVSPSLPVSFTRGDRELLESLSASSAMVDIRQTQTEGELAKANAKIAQLEQMLLEEQNSRRKSMMQMSTTLSHVVEACYSKITGEEPRAPAAMDPQVYQEQLRILSQDSGTQGLMDYIPTTSPYTQGAGATIAPGTSCAPESYLEPEFDAFVTQLLGKPQPQTVA